MSELLSREARENEAIAKMVRAGATSIVISRGKRATVISGVLRNGTERTLTVGRDNVIPFPNRRGHNGIGTRLMRYLREHVSITL